MNSNLPGIGTFAFVVLLVIVSACFSTAYAAASAPTQSQKLLALSDDIINPDQGAVVILDSATGSWTTLANFSLAVATVESAFDPATLTYFLLVDTGEDDDFLLYRFNVASKKLDGDACTLKVAVAYDVQWYPAQKVLLALVADHKSDISVAAIDPMTCSIRTVYAFTDLISFNADSMILDLAADMYWVSVMRERDSVFKFAGISLTAVSPQPVWVVVNDTESQYAFFDESVKQPRCIFGTDFDLRLHGFNVTTGRAYDLPYAQSINGLISSAGFTSAAGDAYVIVQHYRQQLISTIDVTTGSIVHSAEIVDRQLDFIHVLPETLS
jgi:hypothetical protein